MAQALNIHVKVTPAKKHQLVLTLLLLIIPMGVGLAMKKKMKTKKHPLHLTMYELAPLKENHTHQFHLLIIFITS